MFRNKKRSAQALITSQIRGLYPAVSRDDTFPSNLIFHYTYHKCLTVYFKQIFFHLGNEFRFPLIHIFNDINKFDDIVNSNDNKRFLHLHHLPGIDYTKLSSYRGSHVVRDPRDIVVSAYHYHLRTLEPWCIDPNYDWSVITNNPLFGTFVNSDITEWPENISYQNYLSSLDKNRGMILEIIRNDHNFEHMLTWDYNNPNIIELKYETILGDEIAQFERLFDHYQFHPKVKARGLHYVDYFSIKNKTKGGKSHVRSGKKKQWITELTPGALSIFEKHYSELLEKLGYE